MSEFSKRTKTKKVVFDKNFGKYFKKGETAYIHEDTVNAKNLAKYGKVSDVDFKAEYAKAKKALDKK